MKKLLSFILILIMGCLTYFVKNSENPLFKCSGVSKVCVITEEFDDEVADVVECGNKKFIFCSKEEGKELVKKLQIDGLQFYFENYSLENLQKNLNLTIISEQNIENLLILYAYTPFYQDCVYIDNKKVNAQIVLKDMQIVIGFPLIITGY